MTTTTTEKPSNYTIHDFTALSDAEIYARAKQDVSVNDGDVLVMSEGRFAMMFDRNPAMIYGKSTVIHLGFAFIAINAKPKYKAAHKFVVVELA